MDRPRLALALGGGAVRGVAHLGVLRALEEAGLRADVIAGTSSGAIVGLLHALERDGIIERVQPTDVIEALGAKHYEGLDALLNARNNRSLARRLTDLSSLRQLALTGWRNPSVATLEPVRRGLLALTGAELRFQDLSLPLAFVASDVRLGERVVLHSGSVVEAALASSAVPGVFEPRLLNGRWLVDGNVTDNVPADVARELLGETIGVVVAVNVAFDDRPAALPRNALEAVARAGDIAKNLLVNLALRSADVVINVGPETPGGVFEAGRATELFIGGLNAGRAAMPGLLARLGVPARETVHG